MSVKYLLVAMLARSGYLIILDSDFIDIYMTFLELMLVVNSWQHLDCVDIHLTKHHWIPEIVNMYIFCMFIFHYLILTLLQVGQQRNK